MALDPKQITNRTMRLTELLVKVTHTYVSDMEDPFEAIQIIWLALKAAISSYEKLFGPETTKEFQQAWKESVAEVGMGSDTVPAGYFVMPNEDKSSN